MGNFPIFKSQFTQLDNLLISLISVIVILVAFVLGWFLAFEWLHLSFTCNVCKLDYEKTLLFVFRHAYFRCPFCHRGYALEKRGTKCVFKGDPLDPPSRPIIRSFEVEWKKPFEFLQ